MKRVRALICAILFCGAAVAGRAVAAQTAAASDPQAIWNALARPAFDPGKAATVNNVEIVRDRIRITLESGSLHFTQAVNGIVTGAVFQGSGRIRVSPPNQYESQQLTLFIKQDGLNTKFDDAVFSFTDKTFEEISAKVQPGGTTTNDGLYASRMQQNEDLGAAFLPRLFKSVMGTDRTKSALFLADVKTADHGWIEALYDASEPEEIRVGRWADMPIGQNSSVKNFDIWTSFPAHDRSSSDAFNIPSEKADYVVKSYDMDVGVTNSSELTATAKVKIETRWSGERVLLFGLNSNLRVDKVSVSDGSPLFFVQARVLKDRNQSYGDYVAVVLSTQTESGQSPTITMHYSGKRVITKVGPGNYFADSFGWYPSRIASSAGDDFALRYDYHLRFLCPKQDTLVATGNKVSDTLDGKDRITEWKSDIPLAVAGFAYGDYKKVTTKVGDIEVQVFANIEPDDQIAQIQRFVDSGDVEAAVGNLSAVAMAPTIAQEMGNSIRTFEKYFGPYPYKQLAVTNIPFGYGQGWPGLIYLSIFTFLDNTQIHGLFGRVDPRQTEFFRAHETSHQWWGHRVGWKSYHDQWMSEGFATFSGNLYTQIRDGQKQYLERLRSDKQGLLAKDSNNHVVDSVGSVWMGDRTTSSIAPGDTATIIYNKGGFVLTMLRMMMADPTKPEPDARFELMMHDFCKTFDNKAASTEDFKVIAEKYMTPGMDLDHNHKLDWFFNQYVYGTGIPHYEFHYDVKSANGQWTLTGNLKRSGVAEPWKDIVPVFVERDGKQVRLGLVSATKPDAPFTVNLPFNPGKVQINVNEELLAEIKQ
jgi:Peptidase family M1 domain